MEQELTRFSVGEKVLYNVNGVCEITDISEKVFNNSIISYYVLKPINNGDSTVFVPVNNENLVSKMKRLMTRSQIDEIISDVSEQETQWNVNDTTRKEEYKKAISLGNIREILLLLKSIWIHSVVQSNKGRKLHIMDEVYLREAEKIIREEISTVVGVEQEDVIPYLKNRILI